MNSPFAPGERSRAAVVVSLCWGAELLLAWFGTRPLAAFFDSLGLRPGELFHPGSVLLLEVVRLERQALGPLAWTTLEILGVGLLLSLPVRALLVTFALDPAAPWSSLLRRALRLVPRLALHHLVLWLLLPLSIVGGALALAPFRSGLEDGEFSWFLIAAALSMLVGAMTFFQLVADGWALALGTSRKFFGPLARACRVRPSWFVARSAKSLVVVALCGLGLAATRDDPASSGWLGWAATRLLGWALVALDLVWYRWLAEQLAARGGALSARNQPPDDTAAGAFEQVDPTPNPGA